MEMLNGLLDGASGTLNFLIREDWLSKRMGWADPYLSLWCFGQASVN